MKHQYLIVHDYGTGGVWGVINARSEQEILAKYPKVKVINDRPAWMSDRDYSDIIKKNCFDIDLAPSGWLATLGD
ncbi:MAG: hypothetical protein KGQ79_07595 [Proteobacteria bacterium]|nr:hypothetical protein [Pseudomonadota bacterium]MBU6425847.1 hypothetical protein [Rhodospirillales bacterium]